MARSSPSCAHDDDRLRLPAASPSRSNSAEKKESTDPRLSQLCPPYVTPSSSSSLEHHRSDARIVENGFAASSGVSKSAKVVLASLAAYRSQRSVGPIMNPTIPCSTARSIRSRAATCVPRSIRRRSRAFMPSRSPPPKPMPRRAS